MVLYRGVPEQTHQENKGRLIPAGKNIEIAMRRDSLEYDGLMRRDGTFQRGLSETNTVRGHHLVSGVHGGCFISTTEDFKVAHRFATREGRVNGVVYVLGQARFSTLGIVSIKFPDPRYPGEKEVSIRAADGGEIPLEAIMEVRCVMASDYPV